VGCLCASRVRRALICRKGLIPKPIEVRAQRLDPCGIQGIEPTVAVRTIDDKVGVLEDAQVLRHGRPADRQSARELTHGLGPLEKAFQDRSSRRITERVELLRVSVSYH
jgi:hypothetical protein